MSVLVPAPAPAPVSAPADDSLWREVRAFFGLSQAALGRVLGLSRAHMQLIEASRRSLPLAAAPAFERLVRALGPAPTADPPPGTGLLPDPAPSDSDAAASDAAASDGAHPLARHAHACLAAAARLAGELAAAQARAAWAARRLAALPRLATPSEVPACLAQFASEARVALATYGPPAQARLALRRAGLLAEVAGAQRLLAGAELTDLVDEQAAATFTHIFNPLPPSPLMAFSVSRFTTKAQCQAYLDKKGPERILLVAHLGTVQAALATWDANGDPVADLATAQRMVDNLAPALADTTDPREKLRLERLLNSYRSRMTNLGGRAENHGTDELLDREQDRDNTTGDLAVLDALLAAVTAQRDALPA